MLAHVLALLPVIAAVPLKRDNTTPAPAPMSLRHDLAHFDFTPITQISLGPRPYYLVDDMSPSPLKDQLTQCKEHTQKTSKWSIGHRGGGTLQFPEHTVESNLAGARMGAGILECDVAFTKDLQLVCRHSQCDLHTTTNVVAIPEMNAKCTQPFVPANGTAPARAKCCTADFTMDELRTLCAKMDSSYANATTPEQYLGGVAPWRTTLYNQCGTIISHRDHIAMTLALGLDFTPELKTPEVPIPEGYSQEAYAQQLVDDYREMGVDFSRVWPQSFLYDDILYWLKAEPKFAKQALFLDETGDNGKLANATAALKGRKKDGVKWIAPPTSYLLKAVDGRLEASEYAKEAKRLGFGVVAWSLERSPPLAKVKGDYYYENFDSAITRDGDLFVVLDALKNVGVDKVFSDWSAATTFYANCMGL
ncbi:PLC-like phosphodiesterase [Cutaneotrichosporon oleaginosum]|uniref:glycerophosphodiester phosphodiesterase n=1 Tax=Cutaneotrichosporon oleaginosum TaxID=879819 RepID=A0A0J0XMT4_9TREE|nr:PLC-like phosphodiesterase [Cutaneotrichosporon oleaginosum]KLT42411.1 PLC-like phosphodiesterase [Cutaneotrichosporon oleaginosum]TXT06930.1 hypothetical protein COLE_06261 [Cutaneotrichosporon oleaginosum]